MVIAFEMYVKYLTAIVKYTLTFTTWDVQTHETTNTIYVRFFGIFKKVLVSANIERIEMYLNKLNGSSWIKPKIEMWGLDPVTNFLVIEFRINKVSR